MIFWREYAQTIYLYLFSQCERNFKIQVYIDFTTSLIIQLGEFTYLLTYILAIIYSTLCQLYKSPGNMRLKKKKKMWCLLKFDLSSKEIIQGKKKHSLLISSTCLERNPCGFDIQWISFFKCIHLEKIPVFTLIEFCY